MNIAVIYGGRSGEHEVSLESATAVARAIDSKTHSVILIGITKDGRWFLQDANKLSIIKKNNKAVLSIEEKENCEISIVPGGGNKSFVAGDVRLQVDVAFPVLHGSYGEDGSIQGLFEMADVAYVGCGVMASAVAMDKEKAKQIWQKAGLPVVPYICVYRGFSAAALLQAVRKLMFPLFVKPCCAGSSNGASRAETQEELSAAVKNALLWDDKVLIEKALDAREIECSVTGGDNETVRAYTPGEIIPTHTFYDYDAKYLDPNGAALKIPAVIGVDLENEIKQIAVSAYKALGASGMSRVDFFLDKKSGSLYLNEINTIPGFTAISMFPKMCCAEGLSFTALTELLINEAVKRHDARKHLLTTKESCV